MQNATFVSVRQHANMLTRLFRFHMATLLAYISSINQQFEQNVSSLTFEA